MTGEQRQMERTAEVQQKIMDERRFRLAYVHGDQVVNWFRAKTGEPISEVTTIEGIPDNTLVLGVDYELEYGAFAFLLGNLAFEPLEQGIKPEILKLYTRIG